MNKDYSYCKGTKCEEAKLCKRYIGNHILEFIPRRWVESTSCIATSYEAFDDIRAKDKKWR